MIFTVYGLCFIFTYLIPLILFIRRIKILPELRELNKLVTELKYDKDNNVVSIKTNFDVFSAGLGKSIQKNYILKILSHICADVKDGKKYDPSFYLSLYKKYQYRFLGNVFLASHIAPVIILVLMQFSLDNIFDLLLSFQFIWYVLIIAEQRFLSFNHNLFTEIFYCNWYNKLLNYDVLSINALKEKLFNETYSFTPEEIKKILLEMQNVFKEPFELLLLSSEKLSSALVGFTNELQKYDLVTVESVIVSIEEKIKSFESLGKQLEDITLQSKESYANLIKFIEKDKIDINAINTLANEFSSLRNTLAGYTNTAEIASIEKLTDITLTLENSVNKAFTAIEDTLKTNAVELSKSYDRFFEICKIIIDNQEKAV